MNYRKTLLNFPVLTRHCRYAELTSSPSFVNKFSLWHLLIFTFHSAIKTDLLAFVQTLNFKIPFV